MTTIAVSRTEMACDSRVSWDAGEMVTVDDKVIRIGGDLVGASGHTDSCLKFMDWYRTKGERPEIEGD